MKRKQTQPETSSQKPKTKTRSQKLAVDVPPAMDAPPAASTPPGDEISYTLSSNVLQTVLTKTADDVTDINRILRGYLPTEHDLTGTQRRRLIGAKARNYGFIVKAYEIVDDSPAFIPPNFSLTNMAGTMANLEKARDLVVIAENLQRLVDDFLLQTTDAAYRDALLIYANLRMQARAKIHGATDLFDQLRQFFTLHRRGRAGAEPTEKEIEREVRSLLHGHSDGEIIIKNESPHMTGGVHEVVEDVKKRGKRGAEIKVKEEE